jgi:hypothetical protein
MLDFRYTGPARASPIARTRMDAVGCVADRPHSCDTAAALASFDGYNRLDSVERPEPPVVIHEIASNVSQPHTF